jgi:hypothetical protein
VTRNPKRNRINPTAQHDIDFVADLQTRVIDWYTNTDAATSAVDSMNGFRRLLAIKP